MTLKQSSMCRLAMGSVSVSRVGLYLATLLSRITWTCLFTSIRTCRKVDLGWSWFD